MVGFGTSENISPFMACAAEIQKVVGRDQSDEGDHFMAQLIVNAVEQAALAKTVKEQQSALHIIEEHLKGSLNPNSLIAWRRPDMKKAREIMAEHGIKILVP